MDGKHNKDIPYEIQELSPLVNAELTSIIRGYKETFVLVGPKKYFLQRGFLSGAAYIYNFPLRSDDVFIMTYPKSGTTVTQELVWLICNDLDYANAKSTLLGKRVPFFEASTLIPLDQIPCTDFQRNIMKNIVMSMTIEEINDLPSRRFMKTHLPISLLPPSLLDHAKVVYVARDPRDVVVSYYHHHKLMKMTECDDFKPFWKAFISDNMFYAPFFQHLVEAWEQRNHPNMLFLYYEELTKDMPGSIRRVANFFGKSITDDQVETLAQHLQFDNFKKNKTVNMEDLQKSGLFTSEGGFVREGKSGGWRSYFDEDMTARTEEWIAKNLHDTGFVMPPCWNEMSDVLGPPVFKPCVTFYQ